MIAECRLDLARLRSQGERYRALGEHVVGIEREAESVIVDFSATVDPKLLAEAIAVERSCCPFFGISYDERRRRLTVTVADDQHVPALDAIAVALQGRAGNVAGAGI